MNLTEVLNRATDGIESPHLAGAVLAGARQRHARLRSGAAAAAVVAVVAAVSVARISGGEGDNRPAEPVAPTTTGSPVTADGVGPRWDPRSIVDAPLQASVLPAELVPPELPPNVQDDPMEAAVVAWPEAGHDLRLLGTDGRWRCVKGTADAVASSHLLRPALSSDGTQAAMAIDEGLMVVDVRTGAERVIPWTEPLAPPWDDPPVVEWLPDEEGFYVVTWPHAWFVDEDGSAERAPFGHRYAGGVAIDPDGTVVEKRYQHGDVRVWRGDDLVSTAPVGNWGERLATRFGRVAFTGGGGGLPADGGPIVLDAATGELLGYRPIRDPHATYSDNGYLTAVGFLDPDTALYLVGPAEYDDRRLVVDAWHLVAWHFETGEFERLASGAQGMRTIDVAVGVLAGE